MVKPFKINVMNNPLKEGERVDGIFINDPDATESIPDENNTADSGEVFIPPSVE